MNRFHGTRAMGVLLLACLLLDAGPAQAHDAHTGLIAQPLANGPAKALRAHVKHAADIVPA